jgi:hypothetical protein
MSLDTKFNILDKFSQINNLLNLHLSENKFITSFHLSQLFNLTPIECTYILNQYIIKSNNLNNIIIIFSAEQIDNKGNLSKFLIPSYSKDLKKIVNDNKNLISFNVYAICNKIDNFELNDYTYLLGEEEIITRYDLGKKIIVETKKKNNEKEKIDYSKNIFDENAEENYYGGFKAKEQNEKIINEDIKKKNNNNQDNLLKRKIHEKKQKINDKKSKETIVIHSSYEEKSLSEKNEDNKNNEDNKDKIKEDDVKNEIKMDEKITEDVKEDDKKMDEKIIEETKNENNENEETKKDENNVNQEIIKEENKTNEEIKTDEKEAKNGE